MDNFHLYSVNFSLIVLELHNKNGMRPLTSWKTTLIWATHLSPIIPGHWPERVDHYGI